MPIPRVLHQIWLGPNRIPEHLVAWAHTWARHHPEWERILWTDRPGTHSLEHVEGPWNAVQPIPDVFNAWAYHNIEAFVGPRAVWAARSDIVRMELIARFGGVYSDLDVEIFKPIDELLEGVELATASQFGHGMGNFLFAARPNHPAMWSAVLQLERRLPKDHKPHPRRRLIDRLKRRPKPTMPNILQLTGPEYLHPRICHHSDCVVWPWQVFNPAVPQSRSEETKVWPPSAFGNHHFTGTWYDRANTALHPVFKGETLPNG